MPGAAAQLIGGGIQADVRKLKQIGLIVFSAAEHCPDPGQKLAGGKGLGKIVIRSGIQSVDKGQTEAARSLGLSSGQAMLRIILPQAVRNILPTLGNEFIMMIKETSLASTFFIGDLMTKYKTIQGATYIAFETLLIIGLIYLCITYPLSKLVGWFEKKMSDDSGSGKKRIKHATYESGDLEGVGGGGEPNADLKATHTARDVTVRGRLGGFGLKK